MKNIKEKYNSLCLQRSDIKNKNKLYGKGS